MGLTVQASAPGRCGIIGNPTDIYGGQVLSASVAARATCRLVNDGSAPSLEDSRLWDAAISRLPVGLDWRPIWSTEVPRSSGLSGSTALLAATVACLLEVRGERPDLADLATRTAVAEVIRDIERNDAGIVCGYQDAQMIVHGGVQYMTFEGKSPAYVGPPPVVSRVDAALPFLLVTTGVERLSGSVHGPMVQRWESGEALVLESIQQISELAPLGYRALVDGKLDDLAELMRENHRLIAGLGGSGDAIDQLISDCESCGSLAAKLAGAGMGGTVIALTTEPDELEKRLRERGYSRFVRPLDGPGLRYDA